ncbi:hypothetical protein LRY65_06015, partial [Candidatus Woesebacteria bacterium]|nr:hypothetical protein [Candidatus Woesebacteria bacterium]
AQAFGLNALMTTAGDITAVSRTIGTNVALISCNVLLDGMGLKRRRPPPKISFSLSTFRTLYCKYYYGQTC